jgi:hypothetical protein
MGSRPLVAFGNDTYKLNLTNYNYKYDNYTRNLVGRSFGRYLRNRMLLSASSMRFSTSHMSNIRQTSVTTQRLVEHISMVKHRRDSR